MPFIQARVTAPRRSGKTIQKESSGTEGEGVSNVVVDGLGEGEEVEFELGGKVEVEEGNVDEVDAEFSVKMLGNSTGVMRGKLSCLLLPLRFFPHHNYNIPFLTRVVSHQSRQRCIHSYVVSLQ